MRAPRRMGRPTPLCLCLAMALTTQAFAQDVPTPARLRLVAPSCVDSLVDVVQLVDALRVELRARGIAEVERQRESASAPGPDTLRLDCGDATIVVHGGGASAPVPITLADVSVQARPRVAALALADVLDPDGAPAPAEAPAAPVSPAAPPAAADRAAPRLVESVGPPADPWRGWIGTARLEGMTVPSPFGASLLGGGGAGIGYWGESFGVDLGATVLAGSGDDKTITVGLATARFAVAGPRIGALRLDLELGMETGLLPTKNEAGESVTKVLWGFTADINLRIPLGDRWGLSCVLAYHRLNSDQGADLIALGIGATRRL